MIVKDNFVIFELSKLVTKTKILLRESNENEYLKLCDTYSSVPNTLIKFSQKINIKNEIKINDEKK